MTAIKNNGFVLCAQLDDHFPVLHHFSCSLRVSHSPPKPSAKSTSPTVQVHRAIVEKHVLSDRANHLAQTLLLLRFESRKHPSTGKARST
jgi:hypothetical protein